MTGPSDSVISSLLDQLVAGRRDAGLKLMEHVYDELHRLVTVMFGNEAASHTLQPTALVHEVFLKLVPSLANGSSGRFADRAHFMATAARAMRNILASHARKKQALRRGGGERHRVTLSGIVEEGRADKLDLIDLDHALDELQRLDPERYAVVEMRVMAGMSSAEIATALDLNERTVFRRWRGARAWLRGRLHDGSPTRPDDPNRDD